MSFSSATGSSSASSSSPPNGRPSSEGRAAYEARLAALDQVAAVARQGLQAAPYDQVLNQYYLNSLGARQATLRQLSATLPQNVRVGGY